MSECCRAGLLAIPARGTPVQVLRTCVSPAHTDSSELWGWGGVFEPIGKAGVGSGTIKHLVGTVHCLTACFVLYPLGFSPQGVGV